MDTDKISFKVTGVKKIENRKTGGVDEKGILVLNSENQEKATIECPDMAAWKHVKPGDIVHLTIGVKQRTLAEIEAEERKAAEARKEEIAATKARAMPKADGKKVTAAEEKKKASATA